MSKHYINRRDFCKKAALGLGAACTSSLGRRPLNDSDLSPYKKKGKSPNFVVFLVDMLRSDHLGVYGYPKKTSPALDRLAKQGIVFDHAYSPTPWTYPSVVSMFSGLVPSSHGASTCAKNAIAPSAEVWLPPLFSKNGYTTAAFHTHPWLRKTTSEIYKAFEEYYDPSEEQRKISGKNQKRFGDSRFSDYMFLNTLYPPCERWLERNAKKPFFLYIHAIDVHGPYNRIRLLDEDRAAAKEILKNGGQPFQTKDKGVYPASKVDHPHKSFLYDGHIRYVDGYLDRLQKKLHQLGIADDTFIIFTSDHGEGFGEHDIWYHGNYVWEPLVQIPLVFLSHKSVKKNPGRVEGLVNTTGLLPSMLSLAGIKAPLNLDGKPFDNLLWDRDTGTRDCFIETAQVVQKSKEREVYDAFILGSNYKLITKTPVSEKCWGGVQKQTAPAEFYLYDLRKDPHENNPVAKALEGEKSDVKLLNAAIEKRGAFLKSTRQSRTTTKEIDTEDLKHLQSLGYL